ncbi:MAG: YkgJ family cysteine cluster protein [Nitrospirota bacterium]
MIKNITHCQRCGTCCKKGGPSLHKEDKRILLSGHIGYQHLITVRKGEPAFTPVSCGIEPSGYELVKVAGRGKGWSCCFFDEAESSCIIYEHRPLECRLLKCWDTSDLISVIGKDTITRIDIIHPDNPVLRAIEAHEQECSVQKVEALISALTKKADRVEILAELAELVRRDLFIRSQAVSEFELTLPVELFYFGRPLFKFLETRGISVDEVDGDIRLDCNPSLH